MAGAGSTPARVLVIAPTPFFADRGCHVRIYEEVRLLQQLGMRVEVCTYHLGRDPEGIPTHRSLRVPWYRKLGPGPSWHKPYLDLLLLARTVSVARRFRPAVIHGHLHEGALIGALVAKLFRVPCIADYQGSLTREMASYGFGERLGLRRRLFGWVERAVNRLPDRIVACTSEVQRDLIDRFGVPPGRTTVVADGVGQGLFREPDGGARRALGIPDGQRVIVFLGVLTAVQGIDILIESMTRVLQERPDTHLLVAGFPGERERAAEMERHGLGSRATFLGRVAYLDVPGVLAAADLAVTPKVSTTEGNGKLFNYMACALPVVAFDNPVNRAILGDDGLYVQKQSADAFAEGVLEALDRPPDALEALGRRLQARARAEHSWERNRPVMAEIYRELLGRWRNGA